MVRYQPKKIDETKPLVINLEPNGRNNDWREGELYETIAREACVVCVADVRRMVPNPLLQTDLPELTKSLAPRKVTMAGTVDAAGNAFRWIRSPGRRVVDGRGNPVGELKKGGLVDG
jgi:hypothetical protein